MCVFQVNGNPLKNSMKGRWNVVLDKLAKCLNKLVEIAALRRRNYVIDQVSAILIQAGDLCLRKFMRICVLFVRWNCWIG